VKSDRELSVRCWRALYSILHERVPLREFDEDVVDRLSQKGYAVATTDLQLKITAAGIKRINDD
jgi:hypothetical protein